jgi:hypothetical protein
MKSMLIVWNCIVIIAVAIVLVISASTSLYIYATNNKQQAINHALATSIKNKPIKHFV